MKVKQQHVDASTGTKNPIKTINSKVFDSFNQLTNAGKVQRINGAVELLQHLSKNQHDIENKVCVPCDRAERMLALFISVFSRDSQEISYSLQRMIRGVGASTSVSRTGFYTTLVAFLSLAGQDDSLTVAHVFEVMEKQLHVGKGTSSEKVRSASVRTSTIHICNLWAHVHIFRRTRTL